MDADDRTFLIAGYFYPHLPERVWQVLTSRKFFLANWALSLDCPSVETGRWFVITTYPILGTGLAGLAEGEFLDVRPGERIAYRITASGRPERWTTTGLCTLHREGQGTRLSYIHSGFDPHHARHSHTHALFSTAVRTGLQKLAEILDKPASNEPDQPMPNRPDRHHENAGP